MDGIRLWAVELCYKRSSYRQDALGRYLSVGFTQTTDEARDGPVA